MTDKSELNIIFITQQETNKLNFKVQFRNIQNKIKPKINFYWF